VEEYEVKQMLINPYYAININPDLASPHSPIVDRDQWVGANQHLINEIGSEEWLRQLLAVLEGGYSHGEREQRDDATEPPTD
jgi:hypothetical protein